MRVVAEPSAWAGRRRPQQTDRLVDIAMPPLLARRADVAELTAGYGHWR